MAAQQSNVPPGGDLPLTVADLRKGRKDEIGCDVLEIYARKSPDYAVYRTEKRVSIQYADTRADAAGQRQRMAVLNPLRGEINGLIDGWRSNKCWDVWKQRPRRAERYDRRVADALILALENDPADSLLLLAAIKQDIIDERTAWARFLYLIVALATGFFLAVFAHLLWHGGNYDGVEQKLHLATYAGLLGAFFSISIAIRSRTVLPDLQWIANAMDASLRMIVGLIGASVLVTMVAGNMVTVKFGLQPSLGSSNGSVGDGTEARTAPCPGGACADPDWFQVVIFAFIAGFSERFVPDLLAKASPASVPSPPLPKPSPASGGTDRNGRTAGGTGSDGKGEGRRKEDQDGTASAASPQENGEAQDDSCACEAPVTDPESTADEHLPPASGGVEVSSAR